VDDREKSRQNARHLPPVVIPLVEQTRKKWGRAPKFGGYINCSREKGDVCVRAEPKKSRESCVLLLGRRRDNEIASYSSLQSLIKQRHHNNIRQQQQLNNSSTTAQQQLNNNNNSNNNNNNEVQSQEEE
jgi:hypothetical protein